MLLPIYEKMRFLALYGGIHISLHVALQSFLFIFNSAVRRIRGQEYTQMKVIGVGQRGYFYFYLSFFSAYFRFCPAHVKYVQGVI